MTYKPPKICQKFLKADIMVFLLTESCDTHSNYVLLV